MIAASIRRSRSSAHSLAALALVVLPAASLCAQMVSPSIDKPGQPFSYYSRPTDEIGVMGAEAGAEAGTEITPEGYLRTGFGELMFFSGPDLKPANVRIRTLEQGHLPIIRYEFTRNGIDYRLTLFAATLDGKDSGPQVDFIRVQMKNTAHEATRAIFATGIRYDALSTTGAPFGDNRFMRPVKGRFPGAYHQIGEPFSPDWESSFDAKHFFRDGRLLYSFPAGYASREFTLHGRHTPDLANPVRLHAEPETPVGIVTYSTLLQPGAAHTLDFKMPVVPTADSTVISAIDKARFDTAEARIVASWNKILGTGMQIALPEPKAVDTFYANLVYDLIAIDHIGPDYIQTVNKLNYHAFWLRDGSDIVHSYDVTGYSPIAGQCLAFFAKSQKPDGNFLSQPQQYDGWGEAVWAYAQHYRMTRDRTFAEWAIPQIDRAVDWLDKARAADPLHIVPASDVRDNEDIPGHITGYNFLALDGLRVAIQMANETGHADLAHKWQNEYDSFHQAFFKVLDAQAAAHHGYIPPVLDGQPGGYDWGNLLSVVPEPTLDPHDPRVTATLKATQAKYAEGIMTYADGAFLHHYLTIKNTLTETIRGDQQQALNEFYALLLHTSSTHAGFEYKIRPWGDRDFGDDLAPHGWFAAEYRTLMRSMLVREEGDQLHLLSVISPAWVGQGKTISVSQAPTWFGPLGFTLTQPSASEAILKIDAHFDRPPKSIAVHLPWFMRIDNIAVDGAPIAYACKAPCTGGSISVPATAREIHLHWTMKPNTPQLSYHYTVAAYKAEYARRYNALMHGSNRNP